MCAVQFFSVHPVRLSALSPSALHAVHTKRKRGRIAASVNLIYLLSSPLGVYCLRAFVRSSEWHRAWKCICVIVICACSPNRLAKWVSERATVDGLSRSLGVCFELFFYHSGCHSLHFAIGGDGRWREQHKPNVRRDRISIKFVCVIYRQLIKLSTLGFNFIVRWYPSRQITFTHTHTHTRKQQQQENRKPTEYIFQFGCCPLLQTYLFSIISWMAIKNAQPENRNVLMNPGQNDPDSFDDSPFELESSINFRQLDGNLIRILDFSFHELSTRILRWSLACTNYDRDGLNREAISRKHLKISNLFC